MSHIKTEKMRTRLSDESQKAVKKAFTSLKEAAAILQEAAEALEAIFAPLMDSEASPVEEGAPEGLSLTLW